MSSTTDTGDFQLLVAVPGRYRLIYRPKAGTARPVKSDVIRLCLKSQDRTWIGSVQGAVATWSVITMRYFLAILDSMV